MVYGSMKRRRNWSRLGDGEYKLIEEKDEPELPKVLWRMRSSQDRRTRLNPVSRQRLSASHE